MRRLILCLALLAVSVPAVPETPKVTVAPVDEAARAKFPRSAPELIDRLALINRLVNMAITNETDQAHYGVPERFVSWPADLKGDCEDYALSKLEIMGNLGWPLVGNARLDTALIPAEKGPDGHAIAEYRLPSGEVAILDSNFNEPMTRKELERAGYQFFDWKP
jgi:predicted transglutaminase-like cysteine proteinase